MACYRVIKRVLNVFSLALALPFRTVVIHCATDCMVNLPFLYSKFVEDGLGVVLRGEKGNTNLQDRDDVGLVLELLLLELYKKNLYRKKKHMNNAPKTM